MKSKSYVWLSLGLILGVTTGCHKKTQTVQAPEEITTAENPAANQEPSLRGKEYQEVPDLVAVYFDLDQSSLREDARDTLKKNGDVLQQHTDWEALVEGHCDERGTEAYNLSLGQRRAAAVRNYYMSLGIPGSRVATISYGKEKPVCSEHDESCWSKNRRAPTKVRINPESK